MSPLFALVLVMIGMTAGIAAITWGLPSPLSEILFLLLVVCMAISVAIHIVRGP